MCGWEMKVVVSLAVLAAAFCNANGNFVELPRNTTCSLGVTFSIYCSPPRDAATVRWVFDERNLSITHPPDGIIPRSFNSRYWLQITCTVERHYVKVQCIAVTVTDINVPIIVEQNSSAVTIRVQGLPDRVESISPPTPARASLILTWDWPTLPIPANTTFCVKVYNASTGRNRCGGAFIMERCQIENTSYIFRNGTDEEQYGFVVTAVNRVGRGPPSACVNSTFRYTNFVELPANTTCEVGNTISINCSPPTYAATVQWMFNETDVSTTHPPDGIISGSYNSSRYWLNITCTVRTHYVKVQCIAVTDIHAPTIVEESSPNVTIKVQGLPDRVDNINITLAPTSLALSWDWPPLPTNTPDITFCVAVYRNGCVINSEALVLEDCMLERASYVFSGGTTEVGEYGFVVTAVSSLGRGPSSACVMANFSHTDFVALPVDTTCIHGEWFTVSCGIPRGAGRARWMFNEEIIDVSRPPDGVIPSSSNSLHQLNVSCILERHYLVVQCIAVTVTGTIVEENKPPSAIIRVQGLPERVENVNIISAASSITLTWDWPATSDNTTFCVAIYEANSECFVDPGALHLEQCRLERSIFVFSSEAVGEQYGFVVSAMSALGRGPPSPCVVAGFSSDTTNAPATALLTGLLETTWIYIISATAAFVLIVFGLIVFIATCLVCFKKIKASRKGDKKVKIAMTRCSAYESPGPCLKGTIVDVWSDVALEKKKEFASYESIDHIYAEIGTKI